MPKTCVCEKNKMIMFSDRGKAMQHYKDRCLFAWKDEDRINFRRIFETIRDTETPRINDTYGKEQMIQTIFSKKKGTNDRRTFRLGTNEVLIIERKYKGAGNWYNFILVDGTTDDENVLLTDEAHLITRISDVYQYDFSQKLHDVLFFEESD